MSKKVHYLFSRVLIYLRSKGVCMQINSVGNLQIVQKKQDFKGSSANSSSFFDFPSYQPIPLEASKAYASPQIMQPYKELEAFDIPYIGKGKLYELANGHKIILVPKASKTYISTIVGAGTSDEPAEKKDIAHLTEHLLASYWHKASPNSDVTKILKETGSSSNAGTSNCSTIYYNSANIQNNADLDKLMEIQLKTLTNNNFSEDEIQKEKNIIIEEAKENRYFTKDDRVAYKHTLKNLFQLDNANGAVAENSIEKIKNINKEDLDKFYKEFYRPDNMTTVIIGNVDDSSIKTISKHLNTIINPKSKLNRENISNINEEKNITQFKRSDIESQDKNNLNRSFADLSFIGPKLDNVVDTENLLILNEIIKNRLKEKNIKIDVEIPTVSMDKKIPQIISIKVDDFEEKIGNNIKIFYSVIEDLVENPIVKNEIETAKKQVFEKLADNLEDNTSLSWFINDRLLFNSKINIKESFSHINSSSSVELQDTAKKYFNLDKASLVVIHPYKDKETQANKISFKGLSKLENEKDIKEYDLPNNLHVVVDSRPGIVKTAVSCQFLFEDKHKNNSGMIDAMQSSLIRNKNDEFPAGKWIEQDGVFIRKSASLDDLQSILSNLKNELINPEFDKTNLEEAKKIQNNLLDRYQNEQNQHSKKQKLLDYPNRPQFENGICSYSTTTDDLKKYYSDLLKNSQGIVIITIPKEKLEQSEPELIKSLSEFSVIKPHDFSKVSNQHAPKDLEKNIIFLKPYSFSDNIIIEKTLKINTNGNITNEAGIMLLKSILNENLEKSLRENLALTYNASSTFEKYSAKHGILNISTVIAKTPLQDNTKTALVEIDKILDNLSSSKINEEILTNTKKQIKAELLIPTETSVNRNLDLKSSYVTSYDVNYSNKLAEAIDMITSDDLQKIAQEYLTKHYLLEISGNKKAIDANKEYLSKLGEISRNN